MYKKISILNKFIALIISFLYFYPAFSDTISEIHSDTTEYIISPESVELLVELDPKNLGFRTRNHRMNAMIDFDLLLRGRVMFRYEYRFMESLSAGLKLGIDSSQASLISGLGQQLDPKNPHQFSVLAGLAMKWQVTEWYMRSAFFLEPSLLFGPLWQELPTQSSEHWRLRPGLFVSMQTVFDSGFTTSLAFGAETPLDSPKNPLFQPIEPLIMLGFGLSV